MKNSIHSFLDIAVKRLSYSLALLGLCLASVTEALPLTDSFSARQYLGQRIMLDLRYWCEPGQGKQPCSTPMQTLPQQLKDFISDNYIGGVILTSANLKSADQIHKLIKDIQTAAPIINGQPIHLFIAIDQEGGIVHRLPLTMARPYSGLVA